MRFIFIFAIIVAGRLTGDIPKPSALPDAVEYALNCFAEEQTAKNLILVSKISDVDHCCRIQKLGFLFDLYDNVNILTARSLVTGLMASFLETIHRNEKLTYYLADPFTEKNVVIRIRARNARCGFIYPRLGNIAFISAVDGIIIYDTINSYTYDLDTWRMESYADAIRLSPVANSK